MRGEVSTPTRTKIKSDLARRIGKTPMVKLSMGGDTTPIYVKMESENPSGSIRDRYVDEIVELAMLAGQVMRGDTLVMAGIDDSSVSAGFIARELGLGLRIFAPEKSSRRLLSAVESYGAEVEWTDSDTGIKGATRTAASYARSAVGRFFVDGYRRTAVKDAYREMAQEILDDLGSTPLGGFVTSVSTGATFREVSHSLREAHPALEVRGARIIEGRTLEDEANPFISQITLEDAWEWRDRVFEEEGLALGPKGAVCVKFAMDLQAELEPGVAIVALNPDAASRYEGCGEQPLFTTGTDD